MAKAAAVPGTQREKCLADWGAQLPMRSWSSPPLGALRTGAGWAVEKGFSKDTSEWLKVSIRHGSPTRMSPKVEGVLRLPTDSPWPRPHGKTEGQAARDEGDYSAGCRGPGNQESAEKARRGQGWHSPGHRTARCQVPATGEPEGPGPGIHASGPTPRPQEAASTPGE